ncbi:Ribonuclease R [Chlamydiales bacterium SCGC AG-110-P3]|nr:Ribonuclease R [Chlamydiales bacterium SCGC AG-110-P3]
MAKKHHKREDRVFDNLVTTVQQYMTGKGYTPSTFRELYDRLGIASQHKGLFRKVLKHLVDTDIIDCEKQRYALQCNAKQVVTGTISMHPRGFGFVSADDPIAYPEDIFIPKHLTQQAVHGDDVEVLITGEGRNDKGPEGRILTITRRARTHIAGTVRETLSKSQALVYVPLLGEHHRVVVKTRRGESVHVGDRIGMEVKEWGSEKNDTLCQFSHLIGHISDPSLDIKAAVEEFELRNTFSSASVKEAKSFGTSIPRSEIAAREDLRTWETVTIDPDTAKDFDDAISLEKDEYGRYQLGVHIADASYYVTSDSSLDREAQRRCNSTYFPGKCIPMLPPALSDNLCSLKPNVNRLAVSVLMTFDRTGLLLDYKIKRSVIRSDKRFSYGDAKLVLDGKRRSKHKALLERMVELCDRLKAQRAKRGSIEFALPDMVLRVDSKGMPTGTEIVEYDITHQMIEEFMLKANEVIAKHLSDTGKGVTFRIHQDPSEDDMKNFAGLATAFGFKIPDKPSPYELQALFDEAIGTPYGQHLAIGYIRSMKLAYYSPNNIGHYGLSLEHYCHFTSPIRRYVDLVAHRSLWNDSLDTVELQRVSDACSEQERLSSRAENHVKALKKLRLLDQHRLEDPNHQYEAVVTSVKPFGLTFDIRSLMLDGFIHISRIGNDYFEYNENNLSLTGADRGVCYTVGDSITVMPKGIDLITCECNWELIPDSSSPQQSRPKPRRHKHGRRREKRR